MKALAWVAAIVAGLSPALAAGAEKPGLSAVVAASGGSEWVYGLPVVGGGVHVRLGGQLRNSALYLALDSHFGRTPEGLRSWAMRVGFAVDLPFDRWRFGGVVRTGYLGLHRVTRSNWIDTLTQGLSLAASYDVAKHPEATLLAGVAGDLDLILMSEHDLGPLLGVRLFFGARL